jgi:hypothetical protein
MPNDKEREMNKRVIDELEKVMKYYEVHGDNDRKIAY